MDNKEMKKHILIDRESFLESLNDCPASKIMGFKGSYFSKVMVKELLDKSTKLDELNSCENHLSFTDSDQNVRCEACFKVLEKLERPTVKEEPKHTKEYIFLEPGVKIDIEEKPTYNYGDSPMEVNVTTMYQKGKEPVTFESPKQTEELPKEYYCTMCKVYYKKGHEGHQAIYGVTESPKESKSIEIEKKVRFCGWCGNNHCNLDEVAKVIVENSSWAKPKEECKHEWQVDTWEDKGTTIAKVCCLKCDKVTIGVDCVDCIGGQHTKECEKWHRFKPKSSPKVPEKLGWRRETWRLRDKINEIISYLKEKEDDNFSTKMREQGEEL